MNKRRLPPNCYIEKGIYVRFKKRVKGKLHRATLGSIKQGLPQIWQNYTAIVEEITGQARPNTLQWLIEKFTDSRQFKSLSKYTRPRYMQAAVILDHEVHLNNLATPIKRLYLHEITKPLMQAIMEKRLHAHKDAGRKGEAVVNYEIAFLSSAITWGLNYLPEMKLDKNPLLGFRKAKQQANKRYITHAEYWAQYNAAPPLMQAYFEVTYLCACRGIETRTLRDSDDLGDRLLVSRTKGSKDTFIAVTDRLRAALDKAKDLRPRSKVISMDRFIFLNRNGDRISKDGLNSAMGRLRRKMGAGFWNLHLLKSKGISDAKDKNIAGLTEAMKRRYTTKIETHDAVD